MSSKATLFIVALVAVSALWGSTTVGAVLMGVLAAALILSFFTGSIHAAVLFGRFARLEVAVDRRAKSTNSTEVAELESLGFERLTPDLDVTAYLRGRLTVLVDEARTTYALVFDRSSPTGPDDCAFLSLLGVQGGSCVPVSLLTSRDFEPSAPDPAPGTFLQIIEETGLAELYRAHRAGLILLEAAELRLAVLDTSEFTEHVREHLTNHAQHLREAPLAHALRAVWRIYGRSTPYAGRLVGQAALVAELERLTEMPERAPYR